MITTIDNKTLKVLLSETESVVFGLDKIFINKDSEESENALRLIFKKASQNCGFVTAENQLSVEIFPVFPGGCEIIFTPETKKTPVCIAPKGKGLRSICAEFYSFEGLLNFIRTILVFEKGNLFKSRLFTNKSSYRLITQIYKGSTEYYLLTDFADRIIPSRYAAIYTIEHWRELCSNVVEVLNNSFLKIKAP